MSLRIAAEVSIRSFVSGHCFRDAAVVLIHRPLEGPRTVSRPAHRAPRRESVKLHATIWAHKNMED